LPEQIDPFASVGTSSVFFQIVLGRNTPKEISEATKTKPSSVVEHLNKLVEMGILRQAKREGKFQPYEVDWSRFVRALLEHTYTPQSQEAALKAGMEVEAVREEQKRLEAAMEELAKSREFELLVSGYFRRLAEQMEAGLYPRRTIWGAIYCFEESLGSLEETQDPRLKPVVDLLRVWNHCLQRFRRFGPAACLNQSLREAEKWESG
jgi:DNA-binding transcriptional ArsR family regulator